MGLGRVPGQTTGRENVRNCWRLTRSQVVSAILRGTTYVTAYLRDGKWRKGEDVRVVTIYGGYFIRTDNNSTKADNLGSLPEY